jgi:dipeptidyl aminopeptidase/acylaminoacyl peptidase
MRTALSVVVALLLPGGTAAATGRPMSIEDVLRVRHASDLQLAPDGVRLAFVVREWNQDLDRFDRHIHVADLRSARTSQATVGTGAEWHPRWSSNGALAFLSDREGNAGVYVMGESGTEPRRLFAHAAVVSSFEWCPDGASLVFLAGEPDTVPRASRTKPVVVVDEDGASSRLWLFSPKTGQSRALSESSEYVVEARVSPDGHAVAYLAEPSPGFLDTFKRELYVLSLAGGPSRRLSTNQEAESDIRWSPDGSQLSYLAPSDGNPLGVGPRRVHIVPAAGGSVRVLARKFEGYIEQHEWVDNRSFIVWAGLHVKAHLFKLLLTDDTPAPITEGEGNFGPFAIENGGSRIVLLHETPEQPNEVWVRTDGGAMHQLSTLNPELEGVALGKVETVRWASVGGVQVEGLVVYPTGYQEGRRYPTILEVHGGPEDAHTRGFMADWTNDPHVYAGAGYVTFLPNFRTSSNYGAQFAHGAGANSAALEDGVFQDLMTGLDYLVQRGIADPGRLAVKGWSYGGYSTSWIIGHTNRFKVAAYGAGDTNLVSYYGTASMNPGFDLMNEAPYESFAKWFERSPLISIARVKTPCLIFQGEKDQIVPIGQSHEFYRGLKHFKVPSKLVVYPDQPHRIGVPSYQRDKMQRELEWIEKYLKSTSRREGQGH